jgi:hypothetical protein
MRSKSLLLILLAAALGTASCSGFPTTAGSSGSGSGGSGSGGSGSGSGGSGSGSGGSSGGGPTTGDAELSVTLETTPLNPPPSITVLAFTVDITGLSLTPSTGSAQSIALNSSNYALDLTKFTSDTAFLGTNSSLPPGSYSSITVSLANPVLWYCAAPTGSGSGCGTGGIVKVTGGGTAPPISISLSLSAGQEAGLAINLNLANAITISAEGVPTVNLAGTNVLSANSLPSALNSLGTGSLDFVEDVTGVVTAMNATSQTVTVQTGTRGSITAVASSGTIFDFNCTTQDFSCIQVGQVASLDTVLDPNGTFALLEYDPIATSTGDWIEGTVVATPTSSTEFQIVINDLVVSSSGSLISSVSNNLLGQTVNVNLNDPNPFEVDSKGLTIPATNFGGTDATILLPGQTVAAHVTAYGAATSSNPASINTDTVVLRFSRVTGTVSTSSPPTFSITALPPLFGLSTPQVVQLSTGSPGTYYDGLTGSTSLESGLTVSMRALYFGPTVSTPFSAAKIRVP